jgi:Flp pilus assembly protein TadG
MRGPGRWRDRGSTTAELAVGLPALILFLLFALGAVDAVLARMQCVDAARDAALGAARGGDGEAIGRARAPRGALVSVTVDGEFARASVRLDVRPLGAHLPGVTVTADSVAEIEPADSGQPTGSGDTESAAPRFGAPGSAAPRSSAPGSGYTESDGRPH